MKEKNYLLTAFYLTLAGSIFSGYLSAHKLLTNTCAFNESCPYFLGYPACWFGFAMFFSMFIVSALALGKKITTKKSKRILAYISFLGIMFAGRYVVDEVILYFSQGSSHYGMVLPTCTYGLVFFIIIFIISMKRCSDCSC